MTKQEILDYVQVKILEQGGRATNGTLCMLELDGKFCAYSLCITDKAREYMKLHYGLGSIRPIRESFVEDSLRDEFKGHSKSFWIDVQGLHDESSNWDDIRHLLSDEGVKRYNAILRYYGEDIILP